MLDATHHIVVKVVLYALGACLVVAYFVPTWLAVIRKHHWIVRIFVVNLLFGWTVIGWVVAFHMGLTSRTATKGLWRRGSVAVGETTPNYVPTAVPVATETTTTTGSPGAAS